MDEVVCRIDAFERDGQRCRIKDVTANDIGAGRNPILQILRAASQTSHRNPQGLESIEQPAAHISGCPRQ